MMDINGIAGAVRGFLVDGTLVLVCCHAVGTLQAGVSVYRCTDSAGQVELRQTYCPSGEQQRLLVETPNLGWVRSKPPASARQKSRAKRANDRRTSEPEKSEDASGEARQQRCWKAEKKLERVQRQLRQGYRPAQGEKLRQRRREQEQYLRRFCRL